MSGTWIVAITALIAALGGGAGWVAVRTIKGTKATLFAGARKLNAEADGQVVKNVADVVRIYVEELERCSKGRVELRQQLEEKEGVIYAQGEQINRLAGELDEARKHIEALEARLPERRHGGPGAAPDSDRRQPR